MPFKRKFQTKYPAYCEFKNISGKTYRKNPNDSWRLVDIEMYKGDMSISEVGQLLPLMIFKTPRPRENTFFPF